MTAIPLSVALPSEDSGDIPLSVVERPQEEEAPELSPYRISFARYNEKLCEIAILESNKAKKALECLKLIGTKIRSIADFNTYHVDRLPIIKAGEYVKLYRGLDDDIELKEIKLQQDARIFYFDIEPERMMYLVAIRLNHLETKKVRR